MLSLLWWFATSCKQVLGALVIFLHLTCQRVPGQHVWCDTLLFFYCEPQFSGNAMLAILSLFFCDMLSLSPSPMTKLHRNYVLQNEDSYSLPKSLWVCCYCSILMSISWLFSPSFFYTSPCHKKVTSKLVS